MNEIDVFENDLYLNEQLVKTLQPELQELDDLINTLLRNIRITIEKLKKQLKTIILSKRKEDFEKIIFPIKNISATVKSKLDIFFECYNQTKPELDFLMPTFRFPLINIEKSKIQKKFEEILSNFSISNFQDCFKISSKARNKNSIDFDYSHLSKLSEKTFPSLSLRHINSVDFLLYKTSNPFDENSNRLLKILTVSNIDSSLVFLNWATKNMYEIISKAHSKPINVLKSIKDKQNDDKYFIVSGGDDRMVQFWHLDSNYYTSLFSFDNYDSVNHIEVIPNLESNKKQSYIVTIGDKNFIKIWSWNHISKKSCILKRIEIPYLSFISCLKSVFYESFIMNNLIKRNFIITGSESGVVHVWDWKRKNPSVFKLHDDEFFGTAIRSIICMKQDYQSFHSLLKAQSFYFFYVIGYANGNINFFNSKGKFVKKIIQAHSSEVICLEKIPILNEVNCEKYSELLISGGSDRFLRIWKWRSGEILRVFNLSYKLNNYNCLKVEKVFDIEENKEKYIIVGAGDKFGIHYSSVSVFSY